MIKLTTSSLRSQRLHFSTKKSVSTNIKIGTCFGPYKYRRTTLWELYDGINKPIRKIYLNENDKDINRVIISIDSVKNDSLKIKIMPNQSIQLENLFVTVEDKTYYGRYDHKDGLLKPSRYDGRLFVKELNIYPQDQ